VLVHEIGFDGKPGQFIDANRVALDRLGYTHDELLKMTPKAITTEKGYKALSEARANVISNSAAIFDTTHFARNGRPIPVESHVSIVEIAGRRVAVSVVRDLSERKMAEKVLRERVKELTFLQSISRIVQEEDNFGRICQKIVCAMPKAWCYPEIACARIICEGQSYQTENFSETQWCLSADLKVKNKHAGTVKVFYLEERPARDEGPFIKEERDLINICAERLGNVIGRMRAEEENQRFRTISDNAVYGKAIADLQGNLLYVNRFFANIHGYEPEQLIGKHFSLFHSHEQMAAADRLIASILGKGHFAPATVWHRHQDGTEFPMLMSGILIRDDNGTPQCIAASAIDITEHKQAEQKLQISEKRVRAKLDAVLHPEGDMGHLGLVDIIDTAKIQQLMDDLYELTHIGGAIVDLDGNVVASTGWREICTRFHRKHPDSLKNCVESDTKLSDGIAPGQYREYRCKNNMWDIATPIFIGDKRFGNIFIGQFFYDDEDIDYDVFHAQARTFGFDEQTYMAALDCVPRFSRNVVERAMSYYSRLAEILSTLSYSNLKLARTIEEHKRTQRERDKLQNQLLQAQKMESVGRLAGGVAHDFNNMLGVILGHTELALLQADENHELHDDLKEIQKAAKRSADITKQLLAFARKQTISPRQLDLNTTVESMLNMLGRLIGEDIDLVWKPAAHPWTVKMDPSQIDQILANLCVNARDAISGVGKITIETGIKTFDEEYCKEHLGFIPGDFVMLAVSDNGCGIKKDTLGNLFEPFFTTKEVGKGTGLGLATIYGIVKQNNGFINVYSEPGQGSTFKIYLPRLIAEEDTDKAVPEKKAAAGGTETILLVEDEPSILRMTRMMLERKGYSVLSAATPTEAIEKAKNHSGPIDMLMTDVVMPEMNGRDLSGKITDLYPDIRLLFMSGYTANVIAHQGVLDDGVAFIQKPFSMAEMTMKVREVLDITKYSFMD
ncbi:MAG: PocR ligand-binding domain-containing protein, partial [Desulfotignum sp.]|nr:PocR ligand-binding domain-containing protein [Desulfotignum sp.]